MTYQFKIAAVFMVVAALAASLFIGIVLGGLIGVYFTDSALPERLLPIIPCCVITLVVAFYYRSSKSFSITIEENRLIYRYPKTRRRPDNILSPNNIKLFEIIYLKNETEYDAFRVYTATGDILEAGSIITLNDLLDFCKRNAITPLVVTLPLEEFRVLFRRKVLILEYYGKGDRKDTINVSDISHMELEITHPVSTTLNRYNVYTKNGSVYRFDHTLVKPDELQSYARKNGFPLTKKRSFTTNLN